MAGAVSPAQPVPNGKYNTRRAGGTNEVNELQFVQVKKR
jgi:hypothetical protein